MTPPRRVGTLSPRQRAVVELVAKGLSNKEIADRLDIALDTAKGHVSEALHFVGVDNRTELARWWFEQHAGPEDEPGPPRAALSVTLLVAVVVAQLLDAATWVVMPRAAEANPLARDLHSTTGWLVKVALVVLVIAIQPALRLPNARPWYAAVGELVAVVAIAAGCVGAGSNLAVLTAIASESPRSVQEPAPIASEATGIEQGAIAAPAAPGRTPAPSGVGIPPLPAAAERMGRAAASRGSLLSRSMPALTIPRGTLRGLASWYATRASVAAAGPALRRALGRHWRGTWVRVVAGDDSVLVRLDDVCQCYGKRLIDLSDDDFAVLAPLVAGVIRVRITAAGPIVPPATDR